MNQAQLIRDFASHAEGLKTFANVQVGKVPGTALRYRGYAQLLVTPTQWATRGSVLDYGATVSSLSAQAVVITADLRQADAPDLEAHDARRADVAAAAAYAASQQANVTSSVRFGRYAYASSKHPEWRETITVRWIENDDGGTFTVPPD